MSTLVLLSGGLDSAVLAAHEAQHDRVRPVYVSVGLAWEAAELAMIDRLLAAPVFANIDPLSRVEFTMRDVYPPSHWAIRGVPPAYDTPDEDVYLTGRNLVLLAKAGVVAATTGAQPDRARSAGGQSLSGRAARILCGDVARALARARSPDRDRDAVSRVAEGRCDSPRRRARRTARVHVVLYAARSTNRDRRCRVHCGLCSKCRERRDAFAAAGVPDPTTMPTPRLALRA